MKKIVVIGPESTGKSSLCEQLAAHYNTLWVPEYAREFLLQNGTAYTYSDLLHIAQNQQALEEKYTAQLAKSGQLTNGKQLPTTGCQHTTGFPDIAHPPLIIDTNQYVMKVWCEVVFGACHPWILKKCAMAHYDLYLLCNVDLPWVQDGLREYPNLEMRRRLFLEYQDILINDGTPWAIVSGTGKQRLQNAINSINQHFSR